MTAHVQRHGGSDWPVAGLLASIPHSMIRGAGEAPPRRGGPVISGRGVSRSSFAGSGACSRSARPCPPRFGRRSNLQAPHGAWARERALRGCDRAQKGHDRLDRATPHPRTHRHGPSRDHRGDHAREARSRAACGHDESRRCCDAREAHPDSADMSALAARLERGGVHSTRTANGAAGDSEAESGRGRSGHRTTPNKLEEVRPAARQAART